MIEEVNFLDVRAVEIPPSRKGFGPGRGFEEAITKGGVVFDGQQHMIVAMHPSSRHALDGHVVFWVSSKAQIKSSSQEAESRQRWKLLTRDEEALQEIIDLAEKLTGEVGTNFYALMGYSSSIPIRARLGFQDRHGIQSESVIHFHASKSGKKDKDSTRTLRLEDPQDRALIAKTTNAAGEIAILFYNEDLSAALDKFGGERIMVENEVGLNHQACKFSGQDGLQRAVQFGIELTEAVEDQWHFYSNVRSMFFSILSRGKISASLRWLEDARRELKYELKQLQTPGMLIVYHDRNWLVFPFSAGNSGQEMLSGRGLLRTPKRARRLLGISNFLKSLRSK